LKPEIPDRKITSEKSRIFGFIQGKNKRKLSPVAVENHLLFGFIWFSCIVVENHLLCMKNTEKRMGKEKDDNNLDMFSLLVVSVHSSLILDGGRSLGGGFNGTVK